MSDQLQILESLKDEIESSRTELATLEKKITELKAKNEKKEVEDFKSKLKVLKSKKEEITNRIGLLRYRKNILESVSNYEKETISKTILDLVEQVLNIKITPVLGYLVDGDTPEILLKDYHTLLYEYNSIISDLEALYKSGKIQKKTFDTMSSVVRTEYNRYKRKAPREIENPIDIRRVDEILNEFSKVTKQTTTPSKEVISLYNEFVALKNNSDLDMIGTKREEEIMERAKDLGLTNGDIDSVVIKSLKLPKGSEITLRI